MTQSIALKLNGLNTDANPLGSVPEGSLLVAENAVCDKEDVLEIMRGFKLYGSAFTLSGSEKINSLYQYKGKILAHYASTIAYDSDGAGTWTNISGTYAAPTGANKIRSAQANRNFYITTSSGVKVTSAFSGPFTSAGVDKALGGSGSTTGSSGFLANNNNVAYRVVWKRTDASENDILSAPSPRIIVANASGGARDVSLTFYIPDNITTSYKYLIYRSAQSGGASVEPNDELQLVIEKAPTSAEITAKSVTLTDNVPDSLRGATLYTSPSQEGIAAANDQPPSCKDIVAYKNNVFYVNTISKHRFFLNMIAVGSGELGYYETDTSITNGSPTGTVTSATGIAIGQLVTGTGIPAGTTVTNVSGTTVTFSANATSTDAASTLTFRDRITIAGTAYYANASASVADRYFQVVTGGTPAENIEDTANSLINVVNQSTSNTSVYGFYLSGYDDLPGQMLFEERGIGASSFSVTSSKGSSFSPTLANTGTTNSSTNEEGKNRIYISKDSQPEAVPILNFLTVGSADKEIIRAVALRDSVFIFKEDGIFRLTGDDAASFTESDFDKTAKLKGPETAVAFNNQVFCYSDQGVIAVSDNGVAVVSRAVESDLQKLSSSSYTYFSSASFGVSYESARRYILFTVTATTDQTATQAFVYNSFTNTWTKWIANRTCGLVSDADDKLYLASGNTSKKYIYVERKTFTIFDYAQEEFATTLASYSGTTVVVGSTTNAVVGYTLAQSESQKAVITSITDSTTLVVDREVSWTTSSACTYYEPIALNIRWAPVHGGNPGILKHYQDIMVFFRSANFRELVISFSSNIASSFQDVTITPFRTGNWGEFGWGNEAWGGGPPSLQPIRTYVPIQAQRSNWLNIKIEHSEALTNFALCGFSLMYRPVSTRFK